MKTVKLYWEIIAVLIIKLLGIALLWAICFSHPLKSFLTVGAVKSRWMPFDFKKIR